MRNEGQFQRSTKAQFFKIVLIVSLSIQSIQIPGTITDTVLQSSRGKNHQVTTAGYNPGDMMQIRFTVTSSSPLTSTSLMINTQRTITPNQIQLSGFYHVNPASIENIDLDAMWDSRDQFINIQQPLSGPPITDLYLTVFKFDPYYRQEDINYQITFGNAGLTTRSCDSCTNGETKFPNSCICQNCAFNKIGKLCQRSLSSIDKEITVQLDPVQYKYFKIQNTNKITVQVKVSGGQAQVYFQFQQFTNEVASFYNVAKGTTDGRYSVSNNVLKIGADTQQRILLITLVSLSNYPISATISYTQQSTVSVLVIVMAVLGGLLLIALIIAIVCVIKKRNQLNARVTSQINISTQNNKLTSEQIERFFPQGKYSQIVSGSPLINSSFAAENSLNQFAQNSQKQIPTSAEQDCVICLQNINMQDEVRMGYCKHTFHGTCLIGWFKKQRNCPYCRKQYGREQTTSQYNTLVKQNNNIVLKGNDLLKAIYFKKSAAKAVVENIQ